MRDTIRLFGELVDPAMPPVMSTTDLNLGSEASMNGATAEPRLSPM